MHYPVVMDPAGAALFNIYGQSVEGPKHKGLVVRDSSGKISYIPDSTRENPMPRERVLKGEENAAFREYARICASAATL
ncbi:MAG: hypothetical protein M3O22_03000 [Pseudomonadota bacterium]|nr:hypothetical protein [Pseudomonadota bacterium]